MLFLTLFACFSSPPSPMWEDHVTLELGDASKCTIVALHGRGDSPEHFQGLFEPMKLDATVRLLRAPIQLRPKAWSWFASTMEVSEDEVASQVAEQADRIAEAIRHRPKPHGTTVVTGFSQGGMLSYAIAVRHPDSVDAAVPVSGRLFPQLYPKRRRGKVQIRAYHGEIDQIVRADDARALVQTLEQQGWDARLTTYPDLAHHMNGPMRADYERTLREACE